MNFPSTQPILHAYLFQFYSQAFLLACRIGLFAALTQLGEADVEALALQLRVTPEMLASLLDVLALAHLLEKRVTDERAFYRPTPGAQFYLGDLSSEYSMAGFETMHAATWEHLLQQGEQVLRTGVAAKVGVPSGGERWHAVVRAIGPVAASTADLVHHIIEQHCTSLRRDSCELLDAGCGAGLLSAELMRRKRQMHVTGADWPAVLEITRQTLAQANLLDRFTPLPGDLLQGDLCGSRGPYDVCVAAMLCQLFAVSRLERLFQQLHAAVKPHGLLIILDYVPDRERRASELELLFSFMMSFIGGKAYTFLEFAHVLGKTGWGKPTIWSTHKATTLIVAERDDSKSC